MPETNRQWLLAARPQGLVKPSDFEFVETPMPAPEDGQVLVRNLYLSFDPAMRGWMEDRPSYVPPVQIGEPMRAGSIGQVIESRHPELKLGDFVQGTFGWQDYALAAPGLANPVPPGIPLTWAMGVVGVTGLTAYFGLLDLGKPKPGETVVVSGAAGATGSVAGQIAKLHDCRVVGIRAAPRSAPGSPARRASTPRSTTRGSGFAKGCANSARMASTSISTTSADRSWTTVSRRSLRTRA